MSAQPAPRSLIQGYTSGALILTFFGALWALLTLSALTSQLRVFLIVIMVIVTAMLSYAAIMILRAVQLLPQSVSPDSGAQVFKWFLLIVVIEFVAIAFVSHLLVQANHADLIPIIIALIVGIHFLPLAAIFHVPAYYITGTIMIMLAGGALIALFFHVTLGGIIGWSVVVGLGNAVILWLTAVYLLAVGRYLLIL